VPAAVIYETMFRGDCRLMRFDVVDEETLTPVGSLAGWLFFCTAKIYHDDTDLTALFQLELGTGISVIDNVLSIIEIEIPPSATATLLGSTSRLYIDVQAVDPAGVPWTIGAGRLIVRADVTRAVA
jgi:hypothetical protein